MFLVTLVGGIFEALTNSGSGFWNRSSRQPLLASISENKSATEEFNHLGDDSEDQIRFFSSGSDVLLVPNHNYIKKGKQSSCGN